MPPLSRQDEAHRAGFRNGVLNLLRGPAYGQPRRRLTRTIGSFRTDRSARFDDVARFGGDVKRHEHTIGR